MTIIRIVLPRRLIEQNYRAESERCHAMFLVKGRAHLLRPLAGDTHDRLLISVDGDRADVARLITSWIEDVVTQVSPARAETAPSEKIRHFRGRRNELEQQRGVVARRNAVARDPLNHCCAKPKTRAAQSGSCRDQNLAAARAVHYQRANHRRDEPTLRSLATDNGTTRNAR